MDEWQLRLLIVLEMEGTHGVVNQRHRNTQYCSDLDVSRCVVVILPVFGLPQVQTEQQPPLEASATKAVRSQKIILSQFIGPTELVHCRLISTRKNGQQKEKSRSPSATENSP